MAEFTFYIIGAVIVLILIFIIMSNSLNRKKFNVERAWSNIDTFLQQRLDEMESLYTQLLTAIDEERGVHEEIAKLRSIVGDAKNSKSPNEVLSAYNQSTAFLRGFHMEAYPELKSMDQALYTARRTGEIETNINAARRLYNNNVTSYNLAIVNFPTSLIASIKGHQQMALFEADGRAKSRPVMVSENYINKKYTNKANKE